ncbi:MAG: hypothetical protein DMF50_01700 [Acidobacteria bacterium]|nr:MAG: hypothetical protein DMF50_01700 [Acidobacteriota bacterium]
MTKIDLIRTILERCRAQAQPPTPARTGLPTRSPAAGGGLAGLPVPRRALAALRDPQTGNRVTLVRPRARNTRRR